MFVKKCLANIVLLSNGEIGQGNLCGGEQKNYCYGKRSLLSPVKCLLLFLFNHQNVEIF